jgi:hypothetical protein
MCVSTSITSAASRINPRSSPETPQVGQADLGYREVVQSSHYDGSIRDFGRVEQLRHGSAFLQTQLSLMDNGVGHPEASGTHKLKCHPGRQADCDLVSSRPESQQSRVPRLPFPLLDAVEYRIVRLLHWKPALTRHSLLSSEDRRV